MLTWQLSAEAGVPLARCAHADEFIEINALGGELRFAQASRTTERRRAHESCGERSLGGGVVMPS